MGRLSILATKRQEDIKKHILLASFDKKNWQPLGKLVTGYSGLMPYVDDRIQEAGIEFFLKADKR